MPHEEISRPMIKFPVTGQISGHRKKLLDTGRNFLSQYKIFCHSTKFSVTVQNFLSEEEISCHRRNMWSQYSELLNHAISGEVSEVKIFFQKQRKQKTLRKCRK